MFSQVFGTVVCLMLSGCSITDTPIVRTANLSPRAVDGHSVGRSTVITTFPFSYDPEHIKGYNANDWIVADYKEMWSSSDAGKSWRQILETDAKSGPGLRAVWFGPSGQVFISSGSTLTKSFDFGRTWSHTVPLTFAATSLFFVNNEVGWATAFGNNAVPQTVPTTSVIYRTSDGGQTWKICEIPDSSAITAELDDWLLDDIFVDDSGRGVALGDGVILYTSDKGVTWRRAVASPYKYFKVGNSRDLWWALSSGNNVISVTYDRGKTWKDVKTPFDNRDTVQFAYFLDDDNWFLGMNRLFRTNDAGKTWRHLSDERHVVQMQRSKEGELIRMVLEDDRSLVEISSDNGTLWRAWR